MKHFFPFLSTLILISILVHSFPMISASAQQHDTFASAQLLSANHSVSVCILAYASEYFYFRPYQGYNSTVSRYQITLSDISSLTISLYDDQGITKKLSSFRSDGTAYVTCTDISPQTGRYFLVLRNQTKQNIQISVCIQPITAQTPAGSSSPVCQRAIKPTAKPKARDQSKPKARSQKSPPKTQAPKSKKTSSPKHTSCPYRSAKDKSASDAGTTTHLENSPHPNFILRTNSPIPATAHQKNADHTPYPDSSPYHYFANPSSRSSLNLSRHFFRISTGYSMAIPEILNIDPLIRQTVVYENMTPEHIALQNGIVYAKSSGLAVIKLKFQTHTSSCTLYIQDKDQ